MMQIIAVDFFNVPTIRNQILFVFLILAHERRRVLHLNVTANPTARWVAQQIVEVFPWADPPKYLLRDRYKIFGEALQRRITGMGFKEILIAARSPWHNPSVERLIGTIRRECLDVEGVARFTRVEPAAIAPEIPPSIPGESRMCSCRMKHSSPGCQVKVSPHGDESREPQGSPPGKRNRRYLRTPSTP